MSEAQFDQFTRWCCPHCGRDGVESWNKTAYDGLDWGSDGPPDQLVMSYYCLECSEVLLVVIHPDPRTAPRAIIVHQVQDEWGPLFSASEDRAFAIFAADPRAGVVLEPAQTRDVDWSGGYCAAYGYPLIGGGDDRR